MSETHWTAAEKKIARRAFDEAARSLLDGIIADVKAKAAGIVDATGLRALEDELRERRREVDGLLDYRYSQLTRVFARLIAAGHLREAQLQGLAEDKLHDIRRTLTFWSNAA